MNKEDIVKELIIGTEKVNGQDKAIKINQHISTRYEYEVSDAGKAAYRDGPDNLLLQMHNSTPGMTSSCGPTGTPGEWRIMINLPVNAEWHDDAKKLEDSDHRAAIDSLIMLHAAAHETLASKAKTQTAPGK